MSFLSALHCFSNSIDDLDEFGSARNLREKYIWADEVTGDKQTNAGKCRCSCTNPVEWRFSPVHEMYCLWVTEDVGQGIMFCLIFFLQRPQMTTSNLLMRSENGLSKFEACSYHVLKSVIITELLDGSKFSCLLPVLKARPETKTSIKKLEETHSL